MKALLIILFTAIFSPLAFAQAKVCGGTEIDIKKVGEWESTRFIVEAKNGADNTKLILKSVDYVSSYCEKSTTGVDKILILAICGGSGCSESTYTVIDARTLKVELVPFQGQGNLELVEKLLGREFKL
ncbi:hypothetical protein [Bacterioplanoides sp.]|uniref:hypothetical protein n=1 Tax=Bacterioplanoides sp. TaxID=2066072 RepID=UPI003B5ADE14